MESLSGERLELIRVDRRQMGAYLCIARNEVPPAVSKRVNLKVNCKYTRKTVYGAFLPVLAVSSRARARARGKERAGN